MGITRGSTKEDIENFEPINFAYASVNGDIKIRMVNNKVFLIKSSEDIDELLNSLDYVEAQIHMMSTE